MFSYNPYLMDEPAQLTNNPYIDSNEETNLQANHKSSIEQKEISACQILVKKFKSNKLKQGCFVECLTETTGFVMTGVNPNLYFYSIENEYLSVKTVKDFCKPSNNISIF